MALTTAAAIKQWIETMGFTGWNIVNRVPPKPLPRPYMTITDQTPLIPGRLEDGGPGVCEELVLIDLWQDWKTQGNSGAILEDSTVPNRLIKLIHGGRPLDNLGKPILATGVGGTGIIYRCKVSSNHKFSDQSIEDLVHNSLLVTVWRQL